MLFRILRKCFVLYLLVFGVLFLLIDRKTAFTNRLNGLKQVEEALEEYEAGGEISAVALRRGIRYYKKLLTLLPKAAPLYGNIGFCYFYLGEVDESIRFYQKAVKLEPGWYSYYFDLGLVYFCSGRTEESISNLRQSLELMPGAVKTLSAIMRGLGSTGNSDMLSLPLQLIKRVEADESVARKLAVDDYFLLKRSERETLPASGAGFCPQELTRGEQPEFSGAIGGPAALRLHLNAELIVLRYQAQHVSSKH